MKRPIANNSSPGQAVYDPFVGSGTPIIAAEMTGRACHAIEIDPAYIDVAVLRWQDHVMLGGDIVLRCGIRGPEASDASIAAPACGRLWPYADEVTRCRRVRLWGVKRKTFARCETFAS